MGPFEILKGPAGHLLGASELIMCHSGLLKGLSGLHWVLVDSLRFLADS